MYPLLEVLCVVISHMKDSAWPKNFSSNKSFNLILNTLRFMYNTMTSSVCISLTLFTLIFCNYSFAFQINTQGTFKFSNRVTTQLLDCTILFYNNASFTNLPKNFTANSTIEFEYILSNENILFATRSTIYWIRFAWKSYLSNLI
jgi:hypothetical protein